MAFLLTIPTPNVGVNNLSRAVTLAMTRLTTTVTMLLSGFVPGGLCLRKIAHGDVVSSTLDVTVMCENLRGLICRVRLEFRMFVVQLAEASFLLRNPFGK
jgi:hypothetical protein